MKEGKTTEKEISNMPDRVQGNGQKDTHQTWEKSGWTQN